MTGSDKRPEPGSRKAFSREANDDLAERLNELESRLDRKQRTRRTAQRERSDGSGFANALRLSTEFVAAILVGAGLGWMIDWIFGIAPWAMIVFLLLGFVAGVLNVLRSAGQMAEPRRLGEGQDDDRGRGADRG